MTKTNHITSKVNPANIRIVGLNTDKTRKSDGSDGRYRAYFELSASPGRDWGNIFQEVWGRLNPDTPQMRQEATVDQGFLSIYCPLPEIADQLSLLKKAVAETNKAYDAYISVQLADQERRADVWKKERSNVETLAKSLQF